MELSPEELRVLGCLIEKSHTTPEHYPLTTNALVTACNQKTSREPVVSYSAREVDEVATELRKRGLARIVRGAGMRTHKHKHIADEALGLSDAEQAVLAVLMLRGPQSAGELRTRTDRYVTFEDVDSVESVLNDLAVRDESFVVNVGRDPGQSQDRWRHTLGIPGSELPDSNESNVVSLRPLQSPDEHPSGDPTPQANDSVGAQGAIGFPGSDVAAPNFPTPSLEQRIAELEARVSRLEEELGVEIE